MSNNNTYGSYLIGIKLLMTSLSSSGLGGALKRALRSKLLSRKALESNIEQFAEQCIDSKAVIVIVTPSDADEQNNF